MLCPRHDARALQDITKAVGNTPIVRLNRVTAGLHAEIYVKCEYLNPGGSHKDRLALNILRRAEEDGLKPGGTIVEATSGNTGASLALLAAVRGYKCIFVMPDKMSQEKIAHLRAFGAKVVVCPTAVEPEDPRSYYKVAKRIADETPNSFLREPVPQPRQPRGALPLERPEIWRQTGGELRRLRRRHGHRAGRSAACGKFFKEKNADIQIVGVDPVGSLYYDFVKTGRITKPFSYKVEGIGEDFFPTTMNLKILDEIVRVDDKECFLMTRDLTRLEGLFVGGSGGAAVAGAIKYARQVERAGRAGERSSCFSADGGNKYVSKIFNDDWMRENGFLDEQPGHRHRRATSSAAGNRGKVATAYADLASKVRDVIATMKRLGISQLPVVEGGKLRGIVAEVDLLRHLVSGTRRSTRPSPSSSRATTRR